MYKVVGIKNVNYVSKKTNKQVNGVNIFTTYTDNNITGVGVETFYCGANTEGLELVKVGVDISVLYNKYGNISCITLAK